MVINGYGAVGGMETGKGKGITRNKPAVMSICIPQFPRNWLGIDSGTPPKL
jgi:hypothetical protein